MILGMIGLVVVAMLALIHFKLEEIKTELKYRNTLQEESNELVQERNNIVNQILQKQK